MAYQNEKLIHVIPTQKLRKVIINSMVKCIIEKEENAFDNLWTRVAGHLQTDVNLLPLEIREFFYKEILPQLGTCNYGYSKEIIDKLKELGKVDIFRKGTASQEQFKRIDEELKNLHATPEKKDRVDVFKDPDDTLKIETDFFPRQQQPSSNTYDEINNLSFYEYERENKQQRSASGNVKLRDEIGSSLINHQAKKPEKRLATDHEMNTFPMYDLETDTIDYGDYGSLTSTVKELNLTDKADLSDLEDFPMA